MRILHVTEAMASGILSFIDSISRRQIEEGAEVSVLHTVRTDTPPADAIVARLDERVAVLPPIDRGSTATNVLGLIGEVRRLARSGRFDVIHLHSSLAGGARAALGAHGESVFYSPHGFAFLRENTPRLVRLATLWVERLLARRSTLVVTSAGEIDIAREQLKAPRVDYLQSGVPAASITPRVHVDGERPRVTMVGRIAYQKAPWRFAAIARELADLGEFLWVGGGEDEDRESWIGDAPVVLRQWVTPEELEEIFTGTDVLLFPSLWEGMSLSLIHAQGRGIPAVTTDIVGNRDTVEHGVTGFVCATDAELLEATRTLLLDAELRQRMGDAAQERIRRHFTDDRIGIDSLAIYRTRGGARR